MKTNSLFLSALACLLTAPFSLGQNLNPTVEVTNVYQGKPSDVRKPRIGMNIPDSLMRFDLDFNYEVFDPPYGGSYSFKPYMLDMRPEKDAYRGKSLYLKAGAGYPLHPELEFVYSPELDGRFQFSVYATHRSFIGNYHRLAPKQEGDTAGVWAFRKSGDHFKGYDLLTTAGFDGRVSWDKTLFSFGVGYYGLATKDTLAKRGYNAVDFNLRVRSKGERGAYFLYDAGFSGRFASDNLETDALLFRPPLMTSGKHRLDESYFVLDGVIGPVLDDTHRFLVGFEGSTYSYGNVFEGTFGRLALMPRYQFRKGPLDLHLGLRIEGLVRGNQKDSDAFPAISQKKGKTVYPDVHASLQVVPDHLLFYGDVSGGSLLNPYASLVAANHHVAPYYAWGSCPLIDNGIERVNARVGIKGSIASRLQYDLRAGGAVYENGLTDAMQSFSMHGHSIVEWYVPALLYADYGLYYADLLLSWKSAKVVIDAGAHYRRNEFESFRNGEAEAESNLYLQLPSFSGNLRAVYDINPRIYLGIDLEAATSRSTQSSLEETWKIPGYVDLGALTGYWITRKFGIYAKAGNLLNMTVQRNPLYAESGPWFTAGITLSL
ncbi:MAG: hypothetical protein ACOX5T_05740 [Candidatus Cryptobacteroides sp.]|jgi:hypothetical protein